MVVPEGKTGEVAVKVENNVAIYVNEKVALGFLGVNESVNLARNVINFVVVTW